MQYADIRRLVLAHIDRYTLQGREIPPSYSLQSDDLARIPLFMNEGLLALGAQRWLLPLGAEETYVSAAPDSILYAAALYAAAALMRTADEFAYTALYREFRTRQPQLHAELSTVEDAYGGDA